MRSLLVKKGQASRSIFAAVQRSRTSDLWFWCSFPYEDGCASANHPPSPIARLSSSSACSVIAAKNMFHLGQVSPHHHHTASRNFCNNSGGGSQQERKNLKTIALMPLDVSSPLDIPMDAPLEEDFGATKLLDRLHQLLARNGIDIDLRVPEARRAYEIERGKKAVLAFESISRMFDFSGDPANFLYNVHREIRKKDALQRGVVPDNSKEESALDDDLQEGDEEDDSRANM